MNELSRHRSVTSVALRTPRAAAIAGVIFAILLVAVFALMRRSVPSDPHETGAWLRNGTLGVTVALNLVPFAGIAFLWFVGVLRDRLGSQEDRFFATVFLGSGVLFLAMLFSSAAVVGAIIITSHSAQDALVDSATFHLARGLAHSLVEIYVAKTACVFMFTTSIIAFHTRLAPGWMAVGGCVIAGSLLVSSYFSDWGLFAFPLWVLVLSGHLLLDPDRRA